MGYRRSAYGVEFYVSESEEGKRNSRLGAVIAVLALVTFVSLTWALVKRLRGEAAADAEAREEVSVAAAPSGPAPSAAKPAVRPISTGDASARSVKVRSLLQKLEVAERNGECELAAGTIEELRRNHAQEIADCDDRLARRLGDYNLRMLFEKRNPKWVTEVTVKAGDAASRIAAEHGSTLASLMKLNGLDDAGQIQSGKKLYVMKSPRFILVVRKRSKIADLSLNGRFFRRYDLERCDAKPGIYQFDSGVARNLVRRGVVFPATAQRELEMLLPLKAQMTVSEM